MPEALTDAQKVLRNDTGKRIAVALEALASGVELPTVIAPEYDETQTYAVGDMVMYRSVLYRCTTAITTPEEWTAAHWTAVTVAAELADKYEKPTGGIPKTDLASDVQTSLDKADTALQSVPNTYRTASAQDTIDAAQNADIATRAKSDEIGIVITGKRPSMAASAGQYVIVKNSTITGVTDGLYTAVNALSPSTDVTAADLTAESGGGLNALNSTIKVDSFTISKRPTTGAVYAPAGFGIAQNTTKCFVMCFLPVQWVNKTNMSVSVSNVNDWCLFADSFHAISDIRLSASSTNCVMLEVTSSGLTAGATYRMYANNTQNATLTITVS